MSMVSSLARQRKSRVTKLLLLAALCALLCIWLLRLADLRLLPVDDFVEYWAAGRLLLQGANPYAPEQLLALQKLQGWRDSRPDVFYSPPYVMPLVLVISVPSYQLARGLWLVGCLIATLVSSWSLWNLYGGPTQPRWCSQVLAMTFIPTVFALAIGQIGPLILLGSVGFLAFAERRNWWRAGACVVLIAIKPQLLYLLLVAFLLWALSTRTWRALGGLVVTMSVSTALVLLLDPRVLGQYARMVRAYPPSQFTTPTLGALLRFGLDRSGFWLQFVPPLLGLGWFALYWRRHRTAWSWSQAAPLLVLVSLVTTAYGWQHDLITALIAVVAAFAWLRGAVLPRPLSVLLTLPFVAFNVLALVPVVLPANVFWMHLGLAPILLVWFLIVSRAVGNRRVAFHEPL